MKHHICYYIYILNIKNKFLSSQYQIRLNNGYKLEVKTHATNILGNSFNYRVINTQNSLPSEVVTSEIVGPFKNKQDRVFENSFEIN